MLKAASEYSGASYPSLGLNPASEFTFMAMKASLPVSGPLDELSFDSVLRALALVVQEQREMRGLTQEEMAERIGLHRTYISQLECGKRNPSIATLLHLAACFDVSLSGFLEWVEQKAASKPPTPTVLHSTFGL